MKYFDYYVEIKCQLDATDYIYCRSYYLFNIFRAPLCPSSGARDYYTGGCYLWYLVLWFSSTLFLRQNMTQKSGAPSVLLGNRLTNDCNTYTYQKQYILYIAQSLC